MSEVTHYYQAKVGMLGDVFSWHDYEDNTYNFSFFNGAFTTPLKLSGEAAFYTWLFLGMMHPECSMSKIHTGLQDFSGENKKPVKAKKAGCGGKTTKRPSKVKKKATSK